MSQIRLTNFDRIQALQRLGYNEREAGFLCLAALHGGYFVRRQYCRFLGKQVGGTAAALIEKAVAQGHAQVATYAANTSVYHLASRPFYAALGQEDNRNRRRRQPETVKSKLMGLDFVLAHPEPEYLATEQEKFDYFTGALRLEKSVLPTKRYASSGHITERYFVEKYPIFLSPSDQSACSPVVSFCFVDVGAVGIDGFWTFLRQYRPLLIQLRQCRVVYIAPMERLFQVAANAFARVFETQSGVQNSVAAPVLLARLLEHFKARRLYESRQWASFDRNGLIRFRNERQEFSGERYEVLYRQWTRGEVVDQAAITQSKTTTAAPLQATFSTYRLESTYDFFGKRLAG